MIISSHTQAEQNFRTNHHDFVAKCHPPALKNEIVTSLTQPKASLSAKFLYNKLGSKIFEAICDLPEYYPTRTEKFILDQHLHELKKYIGTGSSIIDLGAGNCEKAAALFPVLKPRSYIPIDFSIEFLVQAATSLRQQFPDIEINPLAMDFSTDFRLSDEFSLMKKLFFYPGSSIGNFTPDEACRFLRDIFSNCEADSQLLIGVDLVKQPEVLEAAYNDSLGITGAFNLNILNHLNSIAGTDFVISDWKHRAVFNPQLSRIEMQLIARHNVTVSWPGGERTFQKGETIHTESSYKYTPETFTDLLQKAGFTALQSWTDPLSYFMVCLAQPVHARICH